MMDKKVYSACNEELVGFPGAKSITGIYICGIDTECCALKAALDLFEREYNVYVLEDCCACMRGKERHDGAPEILKRAVGHANWRY